MRTEATNAVDDKIKIASGEIQKKIDSCNGQITEAILPAEVIDMLREAIPQLEAIKSSLNSVNISFTGSAYNTEEAIKAGKEASLNEISGLMNDASDVVQIYATDEGEVGVSWISEVDAGDGTTNDTVIFATYNINDDTVEVTQTEMDPSSSWSSADDLQMTIDQSGKVSLAWVADGTVYYASPTNGLLIWNPNGMKVMNPKDSEDPDPVTEVSTESSLYSNDYGTFVIWRTEFSDGTAELWYSYYLSNAGDAQYRDEDKWVTEKLDADFGVLPSFNTIPNGDYFKVEFTSGTRKITRQIEVYSAPEITYIGTPESNIEGSPIEFEVRAKNFRNDLLDFSCSNISGASCGTIGFRTRFFETVGRFSWTPGKEAAGPDGATYTARIYVSDGINTVYQDVDISVEDKKWLYETSDDEPGPIADFGYTVRGFYVGFSDGSYLSDEEGYEIDSWEWSFGDGNCDDPDDNISTEQNPGHEYSAPGTYPVNLTVIDGGGVRDTAMEWVEVKYLTPTAWFTANEGGFTVSFNGSPGNGAGAIEYYVWSFGDGETGEGKDVSHTYTTKGTYTATLIAVGYGGDSAMYQKDVTVGRTISLYQVEGGHIGISRGWKTFYEPGDQVMVYAVPDDGWYFYEWRGHASGTENVIVITIGDDDDIWVSADFDQYEDDETGYGNE